MAGNGFVAFSEPMTLYPPVYPIILSISGLIKSNIIHSSRWLHSLIFGINTILFAIIIFISTRRDRLALFLGLLLFVSSDQIIKIHAYAWSESPFISFTFSTFLLLFLYISTYQVKFLILSSITLGFAIATRYVGFSLLPPVLLVLFLYGNQSKAQRIKSLFIMAIFSLTPVTLWMVRNFLISDSATNRSFVYHPLSLKIISEVLFSYHILYQPNFDAINSISLELYVFLCFFLWLIWVFFKNRGVQKSPFTINHFFIIIGVLSFISYLLFVISSISFFDANIPLDQRILFPAYSFLTISIFSATFTYFNIGKLKVLKILFIIYVMISIIANINPLINWIKESRSQGLSYNRITWIKSPTISSLILLNPDVKIYSNGRDVIGLRTEFQSFNLPKEYNQNTLIQNNHFNDEIHAMCKEVVTGDAIVVYFQNIYRKYFPTVDEINQICKLPILITEADGVIFGSQKR